MIIEPRPYASAPAPSGKRRLTTSALHRSAFFLLGATVHDDAERIIELSDEKSLELDEDDCRKAYSSLVNPRTRLEAEMAWLPGLAPQRTKHLLNQLLRDPLSFRSDAGLPSLAGANLMAAAFEALAPGDKILDIANVVQDFAQQCEKIDAADVLLDINGDREISGFPRIPSLDLVKNTLSERHRDYRNSIKDALNRLPSLLLVEVMTQTLSKATNDGVTAAPNLINELVDSYETECQEFLNAESENVNALTAAVLEAISRDSPSANGLIEQLLNVGENFRRVALPILYGAMARGMDSELSYGVAWSMRGLTLSLCRDHDAFAKAQSITTYLLKFTTQMPVVRAKIEEDHATLKTILARQS